MRAVGALLAALATLALPASRAVAVPPRPADLAVLGGEDTWHANPRFTLQWSIPAAGGSALVATRFRLRDHQGETIRRIRLGWVSDRHQIEVPETPGVYTVTLWFEDGDGEQGPAAEAKLRFDASRPPPVDPVPPTGWVGRNDFPLNVPLEPISGPLSPSGLLGYAYSASTRSDAAPCAQPDRCTEAETVPDEGNALRLPTAPEGVVQLRVFAVSGAGVSSARAGEATLRVDRTIPVTRLAGLPAGWTRGPVRLTATAADSGSGMEDGRAFTAIRIDSGVPRIAAGGSARATLIEEGVHRASYYAGDAAGNADDGARVNGHLNPAPRQATVRIDRTPPQAAFLPQDPSDPELVRLHIRDRDSGPDPARGWIGVRPLGSAERFRRLPSEPSEALEELHVRWDSAAYPAGRYEFRAGVRDAAGNAATTDRREGGAAMILANPLKTRTALQAGFGGRVLRWHRCRRLGERRRCRRQTIADFDRRPPSRTVPFGRGLALSGRLAAGVSTAPGSRPVHIVEHFALGARRQTNASTVWTAADGRFATRLAPGPSREISVSYGGGRRLNPSTGPRLRLGVRAGVRLRTSSRTARVGGAPLLFRGRVAAGRGEIPAEGVSVELQFRLPGLPWGEFRTVETDRRGRFGLAYRFSDDDSRGARFQFRAQVPAQTNWPYDPGNSRPILVRGL